MIPGVVSAALDVEGAISAAAAGGLARGLILAALTVVLVVAIRFLFSSLAKKAKTSNSSEAKTSSALPVRVVLASSSAVGAIGSIIGILATWSSKSILVGGEVVSFFLDGLGLWSLLSLILFAAVIVLSLRNKGSKSTKYLASISAIVLSASLVAGLTLTGELTRPAGWAESKTTFNDSVSATAVMTPGAQGLNSIAVGLSGSDSDIEPIRQQIQAGLATATLVSLEQDLKSEPVAVALDDQGGLIVKDITAEAPGRWRIQIDFGDNGALLMLDVTLAPNPGYSK